VCVDSDERETYIPSHSQKHERETYFFIRLCGSIFRGRNREKKKKKKERMRTNSVSLRVALSREEEEEQKEEEDSARVVRFLRREERK
jgi:hypothetical protein